MSKKITTERHYRITLTGGSTYYGRTTQPGNKRYQGHQSDVRRGEHANKNIQESYNKYGYDEWVHEWLGWETGDLDHHNQIEYGYVQADPKALNIHDGKFTLLSKEEQIEYKREESKKHIQQQIDNMPPKELKEYRTKNALKQQQKRANETPEEVEEVKRYYSERYLRQRDKETPEQREKRKKRISESDKRRRDNETPEQREERLRKDREYQQRKRDEKKRGGDNK